jgi:hypothetical protein
MRTDRDTRPDLRRRRLATALGALTGCLAALTLAASASATPAWVTPAASLSATGGNANGVRLGLDAAGDTVAIWDRFNGSNEIVQASTRLASSGSWQTPVNLSEAGHSAAAASLAVNSSGDAVAVWRWSSGTNEITQAAFRQGANGSWQTPVDVSAAGGNAFNATAAIDSAGDAVALWQRYNGTRYVIQAAVRPNSTGVWQTPVTINEATSETSAPQLAMNAGGEAVAVWDQLIGGHQLVQAATLQAPGGSWQTPVNLSEAGWNSFVPEVAISSGGEAAVVWRRTNGPNGEFVQASVRPVSTGTWQAPTELSASGENAEDAVVAFDAEGDATVLWQRYSGSSWIIQADTRPLQSGTWQTPVNLSETGQNSLDPELAIDSAGDATAVWERFNGSAYIAQAATRRAGAGSWQTPVSLSEAGQSVSVPEVASDAGGDMAAGWVRSNASSIVVQAVGYAGAGPHLDDLSIPGSAVAGQSLAFSVAPLSVFSTLGETSWSFGDGATATGPSANHSYSAAGAYEVTVTSSDALGNSSTSTSTITVEAPARKGETVAKEETPSATVVSVKAPAQNTAAAPQLAATPASSAPLPFELLSRAPQPLINSRALQVRVACRSGACKVAAAASVKLPGRVHPLALRSSTVTMTAGGSGGLAIAIPVGVRRAIRGYLMNHPDYKAKVYLVLTATCADEIPQTVTATLPIWTYPSFR